MVNERQCPTVVLQMISGSVVSSCLISALVISFLKRRLKDPYGRFHLSLNRLPSDEPDEPPKTEWLNMGYWKQAKTYPEAAKALALKLISAAKFKEKGRVLDVGHGTGESLLLLLYEPYLPRPSHLVGITTLQWHHQRSLERVQKLQSMSAIAKETKVVLHAASAVYYPAIASSSSSHPMSPSSTDIFDCILALDCAYHFHTRRRFLEQSLIKLSPGGSIALADICVESSSFKTKILTKILTIPRENEISQEGYVKQMQEMGYVDVRLEDVSQQVFPGFIKFLKTRGMGWWVLGWIVETYSKEGLRFVIISGTKPSL